jgi:hypothetical protein
MKRKLLLLCASVMTSAATFATPVRASATIPCPESDFSCVALCTNMSFYCKGRLPHNIANCVVDTVSSTCGIDGWCNSNCDPWQDPQCYPNTAQCYFRSP